MFGEGLYQNVGPARLPSVHRTMLGYCRELGVPLEVEVNTSRSAYLQASTLDGGKTVQNRQVEYDTRGHVSELLAKCIQRGALDQELSRDDKEQMVEFLKQYGDLSPDLFYKGSSRAGWKISPGAGDTVGVPHDPLDMRALLSAHLWRELMEEDEIDWQATMFQPVGGMDQIPMAFKKKLGSVIRPARGSGPDPPERIGRKGRLPGRGHRQERDRECGLLRLRLAPDDPQNHGYGFLSGVEGGDRWLFL